MGLVFLYLRGLETDLGMAEPHGQPQGSLVAGGGYLPQVIGGVSPGPSCSSGANVGNQPWLSARRPSAALLLRCCGPLVARPCVCGQHMST